MRNYFWALWSVASALQSLWWVSLWWVCTTVVPWLAIFHGVCMALLFALAGAFLERTFNERDGEE